MPVETVDGQARNSASPYKRTASSEDAEGNAAVAFDEKNSSVGEVNPVRNFGEGGTQPQRPAVRRAKTQVHANRKVQADAACAGAKRYRKVSIELSPNGGRDIIVL